MQMTKLRLKQRNRPLTLLEVILVLVLIGMMAGFGAWSLTDLLAQHRRQAEIEELKNFFQELQMEALALQSDLELSLRIDKEVVKIRSNTAEKILRDRTVELKGVRSLSLNKQSKERLTFQILSTGRVDPQGIIGIERNKDTLWIDVRQPLQIKFSNSYPNPLNESIPDKPKKKEMSVVIKPVV